jgi:hypothetical protein
VRHVKNEYVCNGGLQWMSKGSVAHGIMHASGLEYIRLYLPISR